jgi:hypothetical protein
MSLAKDPDSSQDPYKKLRPNWEGNFKYTCTSCNEFNYFIFFQITYSLLTTPLCQHQYDIFYMSHVR